MVEQLIDILLLVMARCLERFGVRSEVDRELMLRSLRVRPLPNPPSMTRTSCGGHLQRLIEERLAMDGMIRCGVVREGSL